MPSGTCQSNVFPTQGGRRSTHEGESEWRLHRNWPPAPGFKFKSIIFFNRFLLRLRNKHAAASGVYFSLTRVQSPRGSPPGSAEPLTMGPALTVASRGAFLSRQVAEVKGPSHTTHTLPGAGTQHSSIGQSQSHGQPPVRGVGRRLPLLLGSALHRGHVILLPQKTGMIGSSDPAAAPRRESQPKGRNGPSRAESDLEQNRVAQSSSHRGSLGSNPDSALARQLPRVSDLSVPQLLSLSTRVVITPQASDTGQRAGSPQSTSTQK